MNTHVLAQSKPATMSVPPLRSNLLQGKSGCGRTAGPTGECEEYRNRRESGYSGSSEIPPIVHEVLNSPGQPLDAETRAFMEPRFGHHFSGLGVASTADGWRSGEQQISRPGDSLEQQADRVATAAMRTDGLAQAEPSRHFDFSAVRIHTDSTASESAGAVNAHAFTVGNHVVFGRGKFDPKSTAGRGLLAHELAHVAQMRGRPTSERVPLLRQRAEESEDERRRQALESLNWLEAIPPIIMDDNAPALIAWARTQAMKFEAPETSDDERHYLARGLLRVHEQLQEFETRAKRNPQGALVYSDILRATQTLWTEDGARSLDAIDPFTPSNFGEWKTAAKSPRAAARLGKQKKEKARNQAAEQPEPRRDAEKVTFRKQKGMTFNTEDGQRQIAMYLMATIQPRSSMNELAAAVSQVDLSKWWAPPTGGDLPTWQQEFEAIDVGNEFTMVVSGKFIAEIGDLMMRGPKERDFQIEAVRRGVEESKYGLYLGVGTFVIGASALTGGALLGTMLAPGGGLAAGGVLSGGGLLGGGVGQSARAVGTYLYVNATKLFGSALLYGGAALSGAALGQHVLRIRSEGWRDWREEAAQFAEDLYPGVSGYADYLSFHPGGGGRTPQKPDQNPPAGGGGAGGGGTTPREVAEPDIIMTRPPKLDAESGKVKASVVQVSTGTHFDAEVDAQTGIGQIVDRRSRQVVGIIRNDETSRPAANLLPSGESIPKGSPPPPVSQIITASPPQQPARIVKQGGRMEALAGENKALGAGTSAKGSQSRTGYSRMAPTSEEDVASAAGRTPGRPRAGSIDRGKGARLRYANDPVKPKVPGAPKTKVAFELDFSKLDLTTLDQEKLRQFGPPTPERPWHGRLEGALEEKRTFGGLDITDNDVFENGFLMERKSAVNAHDSVDWVEKHITRKYERLRQLRAEIAREHPEYEHALIGFRFEGGAPNEEFLNLIYDAVEELERRYGTHIPMEFM